MGGGTDNVAYFFKDANKEKQCLEKSSNPGAKMTTNTHQETTHRLVFKGRFHSNVLLTRFLTKTPSLCSFPKITISQLWLPLIYTL